MRKHRMCGSVAPGDLEWAEDGRGCLKFDFQINGPNVQAKKAPLRKPRAPAADIASRSLPLSC